MQICGPKTPGGSTMKSISKLDVEIEGVKTEVLIQSFVDRVLLLVTQLGKVGCLIQATIPESVQIPHHHPPLISVPTHPEDQPYLTVPPPPPSIELTPLLGHPPSSTLHTYYNLLASQLSTLVWLSEEGPESGNVGGALIRRPVVVGLALKRREGDDDDVNVIASGSVMEKQYRGIVNAAQSLLHSQPPGTDIAAQVDITGL